MSINTTRDERRGLILSTKVNTRIQNFQLSAAFSASDLSSLLEPPAAPRQPSKKLHLRHCLSRKKAKSQGVMASVQSPVELFRCAQGEELVGVSWSSPLRSDGADRSLSSASSSSSSSSSISSSSSSSSSSEVHSIVFVTTTSRIIAFDAVDGPAGASGTVVVAGAGARNSLYSWSLPREVGIGTSLVLVFVLSGLVLVVAHDRRSLLRALSTSLTLPLPPR